MNVTFSAPQFPAYRIVTSVSEASERERYMRRFELYAKTVIQTQATASVACAKILSKGSELTKGMEEELAKIREVAGSVAESANGIVERTGMLMESEMTNAAKLMQVEVKSAIAEAIGEFEEKHLGVRSSGFAETIVAESVAGSDDEEVGSVGRHNRRNRVKREKKRVRKSDTGSSDAPEWRRREGDGTVHRGAFDDCSEKVQRELRESRAQMLVAKNRAAVAEAEQQRRLAEARMTGRLVEEEVEKKRLELDTVMEKLRADHEKRKFISADDATVLSAEVEQLMREPSLSSGTVSPNSSVSVRDLKRMEEATRKLIRENVELRMQNNDYRQKAGDEPFVPGAEPEVIIRDDY